MEPDGTPASTMRGVWSRNAEGRQDSHESEGERRGNRRRRTRRMGAATAIEWRAVRPEPQAVVRSTLPKAMAAPPATRTGAGATARRGAEAGVRRSRHRRRTECRGREPRRCPLPAQPARASEARWPTSVARSAVARSERRSGGRCRRTWQRRVVPAAAASAASRRASGARSERSERRREGYPPEGARPRSGLDRVARSRSDAPRLTVPFHTPGSVFGTIDCITVCTVVVSTIGRFVIAAIDTGVAIDIATVIAARRTLPPSVARR